MTIVLPHGVLFRGGEEGQIRKNLIENRHIQAIIGLPANIFFGTGIPTIVMVLRKKRDDDKVLIVDASKHFIKDGKNNKLQASDIKRIVDVVSNNRTVPKFSRLVSIDEIRANDYNLNIPRYVDSSEDAETWDVYASMFGGVPKSEVEQLEEYWNAWPSLKAELFRDNGACYACDHDDIATWCATMPTCRRSSPRMVRPFPDCLSICAPAWWSIPNRWMRSVRKRPLARNWMR